jgi:hypothetical protein
VASAYDPRQQQKQQQQQQQQEEARGVLEAFYLGRAVASAVARRAGDAALELLAAAAEQPARLEALRQEVLDEARAEVTAEMAGGAGAPEALPSWAGGRGGGATPTAAASGGAAGGGGGGAAAAAAPSTGESAEAVADELRADVAECRMLIRQLRDSESSSAASSR